MLSVASDKSRSFALAGQMVEAPELAPGLYVVSTPIGNLGDITIRALQTLAAADLVLCEDTRMSARLLDHYAITTRRAPLHEHNERAKIGEVVARLDEKQAIALISDAGTPLLSDPGFPLVRAVRAEGHDIFAIPGASALLAALATAGLPTDRFTFAGFLPPKSGARQKAITAFATKTETLVFYESPRRLAACLADLRDTLGEDRQAVVALELTKRFERTMSGILADLAAQLAEDSPRGEAVVLVEGADPDAEADPEAWREALAESLGQNSVRDAVEEITARFNLRRKMVYDEALSRQK